ncbi:hypothetical protein EYZ11_013203 [Aspergillus tanneri]|uniref:Uncharacterized protein n=1 Tax=Aspergillus tanneri TaxID=1220188 RepID=A0A4S3J3P5_9EURO|nr:hypothetical protein EYZ11_013203 [Aspergillus tanneri]
MRLIDVWYNVLELGFSPV